MKKIAPDLWQSEIYRSGMLSSHAYFLQTEQGSVLIYNTGNEKDLNKIEALGGIDYQLLTHRDEAAPSLARIKERFTSLLVCSQHEEQAIKKYAGVDRLLLSGDHSIYGINILETAGHTVGSLCFFYQSPFGESYLFTGDTLFQWERRWATLVVGSAGGSKDALVKSLLKLRSLQPSMVMSSGFVEGDALVRVKQNEWGGIIDSAIEDV